MRLANRNLYGIDIGMNELTQKRCFNLNFGNNGYGRCSIKDFFKYAKTWKIVQTGSRGGEHFVNLLNNPDAVSSRHGLLIDFLAMAEHFLDIKDEVVNMRHGSYLIELDEFIPLRNGKIAYRTIKSFHGYTIKFNTNGVYGFSIWRGNDNLEDRLWSIKQCEKIIKESLYDK